MKKLLEILSFIVDCIFVLGGLFLIIVVVGVLQEVLYDSPSTGLGELFHSFFSLIIICVAVLAASTAASVIFAGVMSFFLIRTANKKFPDDEDKTKRIIIKCVAYGMLILTVIKVVNLFH